MARRPEPGMRVVLSDRIETLWAALAERVRSRRDPFEPLVIATPSRVVERRAELSTARALGIAASLDHQRLSRELDRRVTRAAGDRKMLDGARLEALVRELLLSPERMEAPALLPARRYVEGDAEAEAARIGAGSGRVLRERRAVELAARLSRLYVSYTHDRPELVRAWLGLERPSPHLPGASEELVASWQGALLRAAVALEEGALVSLAEGPELLARAEEATSLVVLGYSYVTRLEHALLRAIAQHTDVLVLTPTPCAEFWEDARRARGGAEADESESPLLASWGKAAREHVAMLDTATDYASERSFAPSEGATRLRRLQASIRERRPYVAGGDDGRPSGEASHDRSLVRVAAPSLRREVELVAGEIWARVHAAAQTDTPLAFPEIAVWVPSRDRDVYLPHLEAVFGEARDIPWSGVDLSLASRSRVVEALLRLVQLVHEGPTRSGLLDVLVHPLVLARLPAETDPEVIASAVDRLGVFFGASARDVPSAYAGDPRAIDLEQAIERLALGEAMLGERSGEARFFERAVESASGEARVARWLPEELDLDGNGASFVVLLRSLCADVSAARASSLPFDAWARFFVALAETYVVADGAELAELRRALEALRLLGGPTLEGSAEVSCTTACDLARRALEGLPAARGASERGVLVGALGPHRASDHRLVFVLGLGEGRFPSREPETGLDLRAGDRRASEVSADDRDRLALLETVVAAREALVLSWVARDEQTGDALAPAHVLAELAEAVPGTPLERPPLRRHVALVDAARGAETAIAPLSFPVAEEEARARALGDRERVRWSGSRRPLADLEHDLGSDDPRRRVLHLPAVPARAPDPSTAPLRVRMAELLRFLDCPVQAAAMRMVGHEDDEDETTKDAEPFDLGDRAHADLVRALVVGTLGAGTDDVEQLAAIRAAHGAFPFGAFGTRARTRAREDAERVREELRRTRPRASRATAVRFGAGRESDADTTRALDPIALGTLPSGRAIELVGTTAPLLAGTSGAEEPLRFDLGRAPSGERKRVSELRWALRAFLDHAALALVPGAPPGRPRRALVVSRDRTLEISLAPLRADLARKWLFGLARELLLEPQVELMPIESVLRVAHLFAGASGALDDELRRSIEVVRGPKWEGGRSKYGPVRDVLTLPAPAQPARLAGTRFGIFFAHLKSPEITRERARERGEP